VKAHKKTWRNKNPTYDSSYNRDYRKKNPTYMRDYQRKKRGYKGHPQPRQPGQKYSYNYKEQAKLVRVQKRLMVLTHYSQGKPKCQCCGEDRIEFLGMDHINGGGNKHRREIKLSGFAFYNWLIANNFPVGFRVLCHNCNMAKGLYGYCPHEKEQVVQVGVILEKC